MLITKTSMLSGKTRTLDLPITAGQIALYQSGALVQHAFPHLSEADREFFLTGITDDEWDEAFPDDDEDDFFDREDDDEPVF